MPVSSDFRKFLYLVSLVVQGGEPTLKQLQEGRQTLFEFQSRIIELSHPIDSVERAQQLMEILQEGMNGQTVAILNLQLLNG